MKNLAFIVIFLFLSPFSLFAQDEYLLKPGEKKIWVVPAPEYNLSVEKVILTGYLGVGVCISKDTSEIDLLYERNVTEYDLSNFLGGSVLDPYELIQKLQLFHAISLVVDQSNLVVCFIVEIRGAIYYIVDPEGLNAYLIYRQT
ncbi:MAG: hypothetical protein ACI83D_000373 [Planctomycetota bacterium]|jgi:hypothetical protein